ncbi:Protein containing transglutaminase-like domain,putative cysteine protease [Pseudoalteromonas luteoviolacea B = ATCC 29581]|nr:Protein containing transglutaminase-like domain,putative cysteine protease [Pseudoalteromonas luteoviolacea B = ATCC 29581]
MKYIIKHTTTYDYTENVSLSQNQARLIPQNSELQRCFKYDIKVEPNADYLDEFRDYYGNAVSVFEVPTLHKKMTVTATSEVEISTRQALFDNTPWEHVRELLRSPTDKNQVLASEFCLPTLLTTANQDIKNYTLQSFTPNRPFLEAVEDLMGRIFTEFSFDNSFSTINTPISDVFTHKKGVCQDFSHLAIACIRSLNLPVRYVSGYIETLPPPGQEKLTGADATHAWFSIYLPATGWVDFDPTNNLKPQEQHITLAIGRDFNDVTPLKGVMYGGGAHQLHVAVDMTPINTSQDINKTKE